MPDRASQASPPPRVAQSRIPGWRAGALALAAAGLAVLAAAVGAAPVANGVAITAVAPNPASRGARVVVEGHGFGARNAVVRLGGVPVTPDVALGSRVEFVVPEYALPGEQPLEVVNPGGIVARDAERAACDRSWMPAARSSRRSARPAARWRWATCGSTSRPARW